MLWISEYYINFWYFTSQFYGLVSITLIFRYFTSPFYWLVSIVLILDISWVNLMDEWVVLASNESWNCLYKHQILSVSAVSLFQIYKNNVFHWTSLTHHQAPCQGHLTGNNISKHCEHWEQVFLLLLSIRKNFNLMKVTFRRMPGMTIFFINFHFLQFLINFHFLQFFFSFYLV